jgi:plastocyanin
VSAGVYANAAYTQANSNFTSAVTKLVVTTPGMYYSIDQYAGNNPTIYVSAGETIAFFLDNVSGHPFMLRESAGGTNYNTGLTHVSVNGVVSTGSSAQSQTTGTIYWKVPFDLAGLTYVYQCSVHSGMVGNIVIQQPVSSVASNTTLAFAQANAAFAAANNAVDTWVRSAANSASSYANGAFAAANTADQRAVTSGVYANAAFASSNTAATNALSAGSYANSAYTLANTTALNAAAAFNTANNKFNSTGGTISGDVTVTGNLTVSGNVVSVSATNLSVEDNMIYLNANSNVSNPDLGFAGNYNDGTYSHAGDYTYRHCSYQQIQGQD